MNLSNRKNESFIDQGLINDLMSRLGTSDILRWVDDQAEKLARRGLINTSWVEFTRSLLVERNITSLREDPYVEDANIRPVEGAHYEIFYREGLPTNRRRFSIAHEIGHTYFFAPGGGGKPLSPFQSKIGADFTIENLCNQFAASLLLPRTLVEEKFEKLARDGSTVDSVIPLHIIPRLSETYRVAERAVAIRLFFDLKQDLEAVICIRSESATDQSSLFENNVCGSWRLSWLALPRTLNFRELGGNFRIPLARSGRRIPTDMMPKLQSTGTFLTPVDSRWYHGICAQLKSLAKIPFSKIRREKQVLAYVCGLEGKVYIGLIRKDYPRHS